VQSVVEACSKIEEVALNHQPLVGNSCMPAIGHLKWLHTLKLHYAVTAVDNSGLKAMGKCPSLSCLLLFAYGWVHRDSMCWVDAQTFEIIADQFPNLNRYVLGGCACVVD
jgi:hypothetical protein